MSSFRKSLFATAFVLGCAAGPATAQWSGFYFFGDSLTDAGSYIPVLPPGTGRFTTNPDPVWAQLLGARYGFVITPANQGGTDYAQGGARVVLLPGNPNQAPTANAVPIATQVAQQVARGIDPNAVYAVWGGANDIQIQLGLVLAGQITSAQAQAAVILAATQYVQQVAALQAAGAQNLVVFNLPDIGKTPGGQAGGPAVAAQISAITSLYNNTVQAGLEALRGNVVRIDMTALFNEILANPSAFGFTNTTSPACGTTPSLLCTRSNLVAPNAHQTFVFADGSHPTGAAHALIAAAVASLLEGPSHVATLGEGPLAVEQATFRAVDARMFSALNTPVSPKNINLWTSMDYAQPDLETGFVKGDADLITFSFGGDLRISPHLVAGAAAHWSEYKATYTGGGHKLDQTSATLYAGYGDGPWYLGGALLVGDLDFRKVRRTFDLGIAQRVEQGETSGWHWAARVLGGYWFGVGRDVIHGPFAKLVYQKAEIDSFAERAGTMTALRYSEQTRKSMIGSLGWQAQGRFGAVRPFGRVTWEYEFKDDPVHVTASPVGIGGSFLTTGHRPDSNWALINVGASMDFGTGAGLMGQMTGFVMGTGTAGKGDGDSYAVTVGIRVPL